MTDLEKTTAVQSEAMQFIQQAADIGLKVAEPHERTNIKLIKALIWTNAFWAIVLTAFILLAYFSPVEIEQKQDFPSEKQEQTIRGANN